jgi:hypothetical protein
MRRIDLLPRNPKVDTPKGCKEKLGPHGLKLKTPELLIERKGPIQVAAPGSALTVPGYKHGRVN